MALVVLSAGASAATLKERICSAVLDPFRPPTVRQLVRGARGAADLIAIRYYRAECELRFEWEEQIGLVRVVFPPNRAVRNRSLLGVASLLALAYDGRTYYQAGSYDPLAKTRPAPPAQFTLFTHQALPDAMCAPRRERPRFGAGPLPCGPRLAEMRPQTFLYPDFPTLLRRADRSTVTDREINFDSLEMRTTPEGLRQLRRGLKALDHKHRKACTAPRLLGYGRRLRR